MNGATASILKNLTEKGYRVTEARRVVVSALADANEPLAISDLAQKVDVDEASVYRIVHVLRKEALVEEINAKGEKSKYALMHGHHHHLVCRKCGLIKHVACAGSLSVPKQSKEFSVIDEHEVTFYGLCIKCA